MERRAMTIGFCNECANEFAPTGEVSNRTGSNRDLDYP